MPDKISFDLVSPEQLVLSTETEMVTLPGSEGDMGVMAGHAPVITTLRSGLVSVSGKDGPRYVVLGGFAEITKDKVTVLAEEAIPAETSALDARIAAEAERLEQVATDAEKATRRERLDALHRLRQAV